MKKIELKSIASLDRLEELLEETNKELEKVQPKIEKLEKELEKLKELKMTKQKLITLKLSIKSIIENFSEVPQEDKKDSFLDGDFKKLSNFPAGALSTKGFTKTLQASEKKHEGIFLPHVAFDEVNLCLKQKQSLNYELFRAIVFHGGQATTEQIKQYLVENHIVQPTTGEGFEQVPLTDISSRVNYLIRKGVVEAMGNGVFRSTLGWNEEGAAG